jgi:hypothetical protein
VCSVGLWCSEGRVANRDVRDSGWEIAHAAVSRRLPVSLDRVVARTEGYTHAASVLGVVPR